MKNTNNILDQGFNLVIKICDEFAEETELKNDYTLGKLVACGVIKSRILELMLKNKEESNGCCWN